MNLDTNDNKQLSVSDVNKYIKNKFMQDYLLSDLKVQGEISNFKHHSSGHMYFSLKDDKSSIKCVMFKSYSLSLNFNPQNGMKILAKGNVSVFERDGQYQLYVENMQKDGLGDLYIEFEKLKEKLEKKGYFNSERKKRIPLLPKKIAVITSPTGSVIRDIMNVLNRRYENYYLRVFPARVQGESSSKEISIMVDKINKLDLADVIIIARGGGSIEELWSFNEEILADSIFKSKIPIISGVGHETDFTICDFVSDLRAPTPSAAAELVLPERKNLIIKISNLENLLRNNLIKLLKFKRMQYNNYIEKRIFKYPLEGVFQKRMELDLVTKSLNSVTKANFIQCKQRLNLLINKLDALSPLKVLSRGYALVEQNDKILKWAKDVKEDNIVKIKFKDGVVIASPVEKHLT